MPFVLLLGFLMGLQHALEADHLAAVATLATRPTGWRGSMLQGAVWGLGHALTLLVVAAAGLLFHAAVPDRVAHALEALVGVMLLGLGAQVLWRIRRGRVHVHVHRHDDGTVHLHAHGHARGEAHDASRHAHAHARGFPGRALLVGAMHGMAGSAAVLLLVTLRLGGSPWTALAFVALFGLGAAVSMAALSTVIALPLRVSERRLSRVYRVLEGAIGLTSLAIGAWVLAGALTPGSPIH